MNIRLMATVLLALSAACTSPSETLAGFTEEERRSFFLAAIRDAGLPCGGVVSMQRTNEFDEHWRVSCTNATSYLASIDSSGVELERLVYVDRPAVITR